MKQILFLLLLITLLFSCSTDDRISEINIRLSNNSAFDFQNIIVDTTTGIVNFDDIDAGQMSDYKTFEIAYRYAFIELEINGETYTLQPIDYVGEIPLEDGNYTYQIDADDSQEQYGKLTLRLIEE